MKKIIRVALLVFAIAAGAFTAVAEMAQVIHVTAVSAVKTVVEGTPVAASVLTSAIGSLVQDKEHVSVELSVPARLDKAAVEQIMNACRRARISKFTLVTKP
jgi:biopolymer transport protein ExbD